MCGIAGILRLDQKLSNEHLILLKHLSHRGPNDHNHYLDHSRNISIVHSRLSIIDLVGGKQPMSNKDKSLWITYNGELYNYKTLKTELESVGYAFATTSDTEVVLMSYQHWGKDCVKRFRGMFALCIVDYRKQQFFLARDHFGIKPLYYYLDSNKALVFSSELYGIRRLPFEFTFDLEALDDYLNLQYIPGAQTAYREVKKLPPGNSIEISFDLKKIDIVEYWDFKYSGDEIRSKEEWVIRVENAIDQSVRAHLISDVPFGAFLSGGIDSSLVVTKMSKTLSHPVKTFTIGFSNDKFSEIRYAEEVAKKLGTEHYSEVIEPNALEILPKLVKHYGEPFGDSSCIPTYYVSKLASEHVPMVLSGDGGDEAFLGYQSYPKWNDYISYKGVKAYKKPFHPILEKIFPNRYPVRSSSMGWIEMIRYLPYSLRKELWRKDVLRKVKNTNVEFEFFFSKNQDQHPVRKAQYTDLKSYLPCDILTKVDRASMIHGLEVRTPLVDIEIWNLVASMPFEINLNLTTGSGKNILKDILRKSYSTEFIDRHKQGFAIPINEWMKTPKMQERINQLLSPNSNLINFFNLNGLKKILATGYGNWIWLMLVLDEWLNICEDKGN